MLKLEFSGATPDELTAAIKDFVKQLKGGRRTKGDEGGDGDGDTGGEKTPGTAPQPLQPPAGGAQTGGGPFGGGAPQALAGGGPFGGQTAGPVVDPAVLALVQRINTKTNDAIKSGQPSDKVLDWFRGECAKIDPSAQAATLEQIQGVYLAKLAVPQLEGIAKLMAA